MVLGVVFVFGSVVLIHELGHFLVAKWQDVEVEAFAIGFGPAIVEIPYGETDYRICWLPLGGYVKMAGEDPAEAGDNPRSFYNKPVGSRVMILVAGGLFNLLLGFALYVPYGMVQGETMVPAKVGLVAEDRPAAGKLQIGDEILQLNGEPVDTFQDVTMRNELLGDQTRVLEIIRDGERMTLEIEPERIVREQLQQPSYIIGIQPYLEPRVSRIAAQGIGPEAGLQAGDRIQSVAGESISSWAEFEQQLADRSGEVTLTIQRDGESRELTLTVPDSREAIQKAGGFGIAPDVPRQTYGFIESIGWAWNRTMRDIELMYQAVAGLISQDVSPKSLAGPVGIFQMTGQVATTGFAPLIRFTAFFSINLGILNLLPVPVLDGGHILLMLPEILTGRRLPERVIGWANYTGLILLLALFIFVTYIDLSRFETLRNLMDGVPGLGG